MNGRLFIIMQHLLPQHLISRLVGCLANSQHRFIKDTFISWFVRRYQVDMSEAQCSDPLQFKTFNDFFTRALKAGARPIAEGDAVVCPADGAINQSGPIHQGRLLQAKDRSFSLVDLLGGDARRAEPFQDGCFTTVYLSPRDYHRVHMPVTGTLKKMIYIPGKLFSVNQTTSDNVQGLFARNERAVCLFETEAGPMALVLVGAMIVAGVDTVWAGHVCPAGRGCTEVDYSDKNPPIHIMKGEEVGRFRLGSTVVAVFGPGMVSQVPELQPGTKVRMGQAIGQLPSDQSRYEQQ